MGSSALLRSSAAVFGCGVFFVGCVCVLLCSLTHTIYHVKLTRPLSPLRLHTHTQNEVLAPIAQRITLLHEHPEKYMAELSLRLPLPTTTDAAHNSASAASSPDSALNSSGAVDPLTRTTPFDVVFVDCVAPSDHTISSLASYGGSGGSGSHPAQPLHRVMSALQASGSLVCGPPPPGAEVDRDTERLLHLARIIAARRVVVRTTRSLASDPAQVLHSYRARHIEYRAFAPFLAVAAQAQTDAAASPSNPSAANVKYM
jgi:hypothetical protein